MIFLWSNFGRDDERAFVISPDESSKEWIQHQYNCVRCFQFKIKGTVDLVPDEIGKVFEDGLGCGNQYLPEFFNTKLPVEWHVSEILGEALCKLVDGRYVATSNCD